MEHDDALLLHLLTTVPVQLLAQADARIHGHKDTIAALHGANHALHAHTTLADDVISTLHRRCVTLSKQIDALHHDYDAHWMFMIWLFGANDHPASHLAWD